MAESLRDQLEANYDKIVGEETAEPVAPSTGSGEATTPPAASADVSSLPAADQEKPGRTAGRARDEHGRLLPGKPVRPEAEAPAVPAAPETPTKPFPQRPSSWKKDYWDHWGKLDPSVAEYINQRESEYAKGVSTYKTEWERAKPLIDAVAPFQEELARNNINPAQQIGRYFQLHKDFAFGTPEVKLQRFLQLAQDYQVPVQNLFVQGQDGRLYFNQQLLQSAQQAPQQQAQQPDPRKLVKDMLAEERALEQIAAMSVDQQKFPHFEEVRETMAGLLQAGLAQDYPSAYEAALRMPAHSEIFDSMQKQQREKEEKEKAEASRKAAEAARRNNLSVKSATPATSGSVAPKGRRAQLEAAYDEHVGGRV